MTRCSKKYSFSYHPSCLHAGSVHVHNDLLVWSPYIWPFHIACRHWWTFSEAYWISVSHLRSCFNRSRASRFVKSLLLHSCSISRRSSTPCFWSLLMSSVVGFHFHHLIAQSWRLKFACVISFQHPRCILRSQTWYDFRVSISWVGWSPFSLLRLLFPWTFRPPHSLYAS